MTKRLGQRRLVALAAAAAAAVGTGLALNALTASGGRIANGPLRLARGLGESPTPFVRGHAVYGVGGRRQIELTAPVSGALMGPLSPAAIASPNGRFVAYNTWLERRAVDPALSFSKQGIKEGEAIATPSVRVLDATNGRDELLADGAYSVAWRRDGTIAYVEGVDRDFSAGHEFTGRVVVRRGLHASPVVWGEEPARYIVYGWAGRRLIVYRLSEGEHLDTYVFDGPGQFRLLAPGSVVALSPNGSQAFVVAPDGAQARVLNLADGSEAGSLDVRSTTPSLEWIAYSGSWTGDHVVASTNHGLAVFRVSAGKVALEQVLGLEGGMLQEPQFVDASAREIAAVIGLGGESAGTNAIVDCDRVARTCAQSDPAPAREWLRLLDNPSRDDQGGS